MKKIFFTITILLITTASFGQFSDNLGNSSQLNSVKKTINTGNHNCTPPTLPKKWKFNNYNRRFTFRAYMYDNCAYTATELDSTNGWNKIGRISFIRNSSANKFKMHLGWIFRDDPDKISFSLFFHDNDEGYFVSHKIDERYFSGANSTVDMYLGEKVMGMIINNENDIQNYKVKSLGIREDNSYLAVSGDSYVAKTFYFGGRSTAPHKMEMEFHDLDVDYKGYQTKFNSSDILTWNLSEFNSPDDFDYYSSDIINGSVPDKSFVQYHSNYTNKEYQKCIVHNGAQITFNAGKKVYLYPGFYAEEGSYFKATITETKAVTIKESPSSFAESINYKTENAKSVEFALYLDNSRDSLIYSTQTYISDSLVEINIDTILPNQQYFAVADFYSGKGSKTRVKGFVSNDNYGLKNNSFSGYGNKSSSHKISVYPNPSNSVFNIVTHGEIFIKNIKLITVNGQVILNKELLTENSTFFVIDISKNKKGIYFLKVRTSAGVETFRLVKL